MDFLRIIPLTDVPRPEVFQACRNLQEFLGSIISAFKESSDAREKIAYLSVYLAFRDHYPSYLKKLDPHVVSEMNHFVELADSKIIKLRRIALSEIAKVA